MPQADMVIFHEPDVLEFSGNGRSLMTFHTPDAYGCLKDYQAMPSGDRKCAINDLYTVLIEHPLKVIDVDPLTLTSEGQS